MRNDISKVTNIFIYILIGIVLSILATYYKSIALGIAIVFVTVICIANGIIRDLW